MFEKLYYEDLRRKTIESIDEAIARGILPVEDRQNKIDYYDQWFNCPFWSIITNEGKKYYVDEETRQFYFRMAIFLSVVGSIFVIFSVLSIAKLIGII